MKYIQNFIIHIQERIRGLAYRQTGFTLLETMVAVTLLSVAIVAPMGLTAQSLASAYYARDQVTAFYLAQEALEAVRNVRDNNILSNSQGNTPVDLLNGIPSKSGAPFRIDARNNAMVLCSDDGGTCNYLQTDLTSGLFGYGGGLTIPTQFLRIVTACFVQPNAACNGTPTDEVKLTVSVTWKTGGLQARTVNLSENLYRWVADSSATP